MMYVLKASAPWETDSYSQNISWGSNRKTVTISQVGEHEGLEEKGSREEGKNYLDLEYI